MPKLVPKGPHLGNKFSKGTPFGQFAKYIAFQLPRAQKSQLKVKRLLLLKVDSNHDRID